jgi:hypothetical protein
MNDSVPKTSEAGLGLLVDVAVDALIAAGTRPTVKRLQELVGGSHRQVRTLLDGWWRRLAIKLSQNPERTRVTIADEEAAESFVRRALDEARHRLRGSKESSRSRRSDADEQSYIGPLGGSASLRAAYKAAEQQLVELRSKERAMLDKLARMRTVLHTTERRAAALASALKNLGQFEPTPSRPRSRKAAFT